MKVERKNKDLKLIKARFVTDSEKLFAALKWVLVSFSCYIEETGAFLHVSRGFSFFQLLLRTPRTEGTPYNRFSFFQLLQCRGKGQGYF